MKKTKILRKIIQLFSKNLLTNKIRYATMKSQRRDKPHSTKEREVQTKDLEDEVHGSTHTKRSGHLINESFVIGITTTDSEVRPKNNQ